MTDTNTENTAAAATPVWTPREQNGVKEYRPGSVGSRVWALADAITQREGAWCPAATLIAEGTAAGINEGSCRAGYATWRKFNGLAGTRIDNPAKATEKAAKEQAKAAEKAAKEQAKADAAAKKAEEKAAKEAAKAEKARLKAEEKEAKAAEKAAAAEAAAAEQAPADPA